MLNLEQTIKGWGLIRIPFKYAVSIEALQDAARKEGSYAIEKEKTDLFKVCLKDNGLCIAKIKTKDNVCEQLYCSPTEENLKLIKEFDAKLSSHVPAAALSEKPPEFNELFDRETRNKIHNIGKIEYSKRKGSLTLTLSKGDLYTVQQAIMQEGYAWKESKKGVYTLSKEGVGKPIAIITATRYLKATLITITFLNVRESKEIITNFIGNLTSRQKIKPPPMLIKP